LSFWGNYTHREYFFYQAEDGIRDKLVTGVQTCALPIWSEVRRRNLAGLVRQSDDGYDGGFRRRHEAAVRRPTTYRHCRRKLWREIGRASCRATASGRGAIVLLISSWWSTL